MSFKLPLKGRFATLALCTRKPLLRLSTWYFLLALLFFSPPFLFVSCLFASLFTCCVFFYLQGDSCMQKHRGSLSFKSPPSLKIAPFSKEVYLWIPQWDTILDPDLFSFICIGAHELHFDPERTNFKKIHSCHIVSFLQMIKNVSCSSPWTTTPFMTEIF